MPKRKALHQAAEGLSPCKRKSVRRCSCCGTEQRRGDPRSSPCLALFLLPSSTRMKAKARFTLLPHDAVFVLYVTHARSSRESAGVDEARGYNSCLPPSSLFPPLAPSFNVTTCRQTRNNCAVLLFNIPVRKGRPLIGAKYMPILWTKFLIGGPWRAGRRAVAKALSSTLERGGWAYVDLYQVRSCP